MPPKIKFKKTHIDAKLPTKAYEDAAMWDIYAVEETQVCSEKGKVIPVGLRIELPPKWTCLVFTRSGHGFKGGRVHLGVIDADYRGDISPYVFNHSKDIFFVGKGDKIAQLFFMPVPQIEVVEVEELSKTERGEKGFGSSDENKKE